MKPESRKNDILIQETNEKEILIYDLTTNKAFLLNQMSGAIWNLCNGKREIPNISQILSTSLNKEISEEFVFLAIDQLKKVNLLLPGKTDAKYENFNRREVIRKIGLGTALMLPVVASIVAPNAVCAASCINTGGNQPGQPTATVNACTPTLTVVAALKQSCCSNLYRDFVPSGACPAGQNRGTGTCCPPTGGPGCQ